MDRIYTMFYPCKYFMWLFLALLFKCSYFLLLVFVCKVYNIRMPIFVLYMEKLELVIDLEMVLYVLITSSPWSIGMTIGSKPNVNFLEIVVPFAIFMQTHLCFDLCKCFINQEMIQSFDYIILCFNCKYLSFTPTMQLANLFFCWNLILMKLLEFYVKLCPIITLFISF